MIFYAFTCDNDNDSQWIDKSCKERGKLCENLKIKK